MKRIWLFSATIGLLSLFSLNVSAADLKAGDQAPEFTLPNQEGKEVNLSDYKGQWVVLYFYPKNDTPGCTAEACSFRDNINRLIAQQATILGVSIDDVASHESFKSKYKLPFDLLADAEGTVTESYNALLNLKFIKFAKRHSFIIDPNGRLAKVYRDVNPDTHVRDVIKDLKDLQTSSS